MELDTAEQIKKIEVKKNNNRKKKSDKKKRFSFQLNFLHSKLNAQTKIIKTHFSHFSTFQNVFFSFNPF